MGTGLLAITCTHASETEMIVFLSGLSGVGKTTTARAFAARHAQFKHIIASRLISRAGARTQPSDSADVKRNQQVLLREFAQIRRSFPNYDILLDGHMVIETTRGEEIVGDEVIDELAATHFIAVIDDPRRIYSTRQLGLSEAFLSLGKLERLQDLEIVTTRRQAERRECPFFAVQSGEVEALELIFGLFADSCG
jgi:adenylate kinase